MRPLSSSQAIGPALRSTRQLLFQPFQWRAYLKLTLAAVCATGILVNYRFIVPDAFAFELPTIPPEFRQATGFWVLVAIGALIALDLLLLLFYAVIRLRFAVFHALTHGGRDLRPGWNLNASQSGRYAFANLLVWLVILALLAVLAGVILVVVFTVFTLRTPDGKLDTGVFLILFFPTAGFAFLIPLIAIIAETVLQDFILPHMALEGASFRQAWRAVRPRIRAERENFLSYLLLRILILLIAGSILAALVWVLMWPVFFVLHASAAGYNTLLDEATGFLAFCRIALDIVFAATGIAAGAAAAALFGGPLSVFLRFHALYFYGSRYQPLANLLPAQPSEIPAAQSASW